MVPWSGIVSVSVQLHDGKPPTMRHVFDFLLFCFFFVFFFVFFLAFHSYQACRIGQHMIFFFSILLLFFFTFQVYYTISLYFYYTFLSVSTTTLIMAAIVVWLDAVCCICSCSVSGGAKVLDKL